MADFDERAIRAPTQPGQTIRASDLSPWMVWSAAAAIGALALIGLYLGVRGGHPAAGVALTLARGAALDPATAAAAAPASPLPKDEPWSTLNGPAVLPKSAPKVVASDEGDSGDDASDEPAAAVAADQPDATPDTVTPLEPQTPAAPEPAPAPARPNDGGGIY
jgi:hypothetical protein